MRLSFTKHAQKDLAALNASQKDKIIQALEQILVNPEHADLRQIKIKPGQWRLRVGDWRLILEVDLIRQMAMPCRSPANHENKAWRPGLTWADLEVCPTKRFFPETGNRKPETISKL